MTTEYDYSYSLSSSLIVQGEQLGAWFDHQDRVSLVKLSPDGMALGSCSWDATIRVSVLLAVIDLAVVFSSSTDMGMNVSLFLSVLCVACSVEICLSIIEL